MKSWPAAFLAFLTLLLVAQRHARADGTELGWLIYSNPYVDRYYGQVMGQARQIVGVHTGQDPKSGARVVIVLDQGGNSVSIATSSRADEAALLKGLHMGKTLDVVGCRHPKRFASEERISNGCTNYTYSATFACLPNDTRSLLDTWSFDPTRYYEVNSRELTLYVTELRCP
jgi:hypothetical protein